jgi:hypothetical protein
VRREAVRRAPPLRDVPLREVERRAPPLRELALRARVDLDADAVVFRFAAVLRELRDFEAAPLLRPVDVERVRDDFDALAPVARFACPVTVFWRSARSFCTDRVNLRASRRLFVSARSRSLPRSRVPRPTSLRSDLSAPCAVSNASSKRLIAASYSRLRAELPVRRCREAAVLRLRELVVRLLVPFRVVDRDGLIPLAPLVGCRARAP